MFKSVSADGKYIAVLKFCLPITLNGMGGGSSDVTSCFVALMNL